eukprot:56569-Pleurochrysis_carterae.AAC.2
MDVTAGQDRARREVMAPKIFSVWAQLAEQISFAPSLLVFFAIYIVNKRQADTTDCIGAAPVVAQTTPC